MRAHSQHLSTPARERRLIHPGDPPVPESKMAVGSIMAEYGTWNELTKLRAAQAAEAKAKAEGKSGESLLTIPRGKHPKLDALDDLLETGAHIAKWQRKWLTGGPMVLLLCTAAQFMRLAFLIFSAGALGKGLSPAKVIEEYTFAMFSTAGPVFSCSPHSHQPT